MPNFQWVMENQIITHIHIYLVIPRVMTLGVCIKWVRNKVSVNCMTSIETGLFECPHGVSKCFCFAHALSASMGLQASWVALCANSCQQSTAVSSQKEQQEEKERKCSCGKLCQDFTSLTFVKTLQPSPCWWSRWKVGWSKEEATRKAGLGWHPPLRYDPYHWPLSKSE